jgi:hypothetical protein
MKSQLFTLIFLMVLSSLKGYSQTDKEIIIKVEMNLSAFGVESDDFPSIKAEIDFIKDTSTCVKSYYNPAYKSLTYSLNRTEMVEILNLLKNADLKVLKTEYKVNMTDQPVSNTVICTNKRKYSIYDYGLAGEYPLQNLYKIVYKL